MTLTISNKGWVVIPAGLRKKYGLQPGTRVCIVDYGGVLSLIPALDEPIEQAAGMFKGPTSLTRALVAEHQKELAGER
jgi:AbrB family looped-hinge helix DNA binding protein